MNLRIGRVSPTLASLLGPGYSRCRRCKTPWNWVHYHVTDYSPGHGCLPLCEKCWIELTPEQRLPFYRNLIESWRFDDDELTLDETWNSVKAAVLSGL